MVERAASADDSGGAEAIEVDVVLTAIAHGQFSQQADMSFACGLTSVAHFACGLTCVLNGYLRIIALTSSRARMPRKRFWITMAARRFKLSICIAS